ncbi:MAG: putative Sulfate-transporting ATPase [Frankiales bacterium]|nr:putative Sulfate-transporting ATPase [Frankiales bacterium]
MTVVLEVEDLEVRYGGNVAVQGLNVRAEQGRITGLLGPNGAGKSTTFNVCSGLLRPSKGSVRLHGKDVGGLGPSQRARRGLGRTFQRLELYDTMTVRENVELGLEAGLSGRRPWSILVAPTSERRATREAAERTMEQCGITDLASSRAGQLTLGQRRLVELARVLAGQFDVLLMDEPSSGLDKEETAAFAEVLLDVIADGERAILMVEHDMALVMQVCSYLYVMDFGRPVFDGLPDEVMASPLVRAAYLGDDAEGLEPAGA